MLQAWEWKSVCYTAIPAAFANTWICVYRAGSGYLNATCFILAVWIETS